MENVILAPRRATVLFDSVVTDASIATLVDKIHAVTQELYYKEVELQISLSRWKRVVAQVLRNGSRGPQG